MDKDKKDGFGKEGEDLATALSRKQEIIKEKLNRISAKANVLTGENDMVELNPNNPQHKEWFEEDEYKGN